MPQYTPDQQQFIYAQMQQTQMMMQMPAQPGMPQFTPEQQ